LPEANFVKTHRIWIEIVILGTAIAFALAVLIASLGAAAGAAVGQVVQIPADPATTGQTYEGMVTCSRCGAKHSATLGKTAAVCVRVCVHEGATFALVNADSSYLLDGDSYTLKQLAGQRARIVGSLNGKTIKVASVVGT
jgi:hypothetical protein